MWLLIICEDDNADCEVTTHDSYAEGMSVLRDKAEKLWDSDEVPPNKKNWTLETIKEWYEGENNINTIHLKALQINNVGTEPKEQLTYCSCGNSVAGHYWDKGKCPCGINTEHIHCENCGHITQMG